MKRVILPASLSIVSLFGCASTASTGAEPVPAASPATEEDSSEDPAEEVRNLERELAVAQARLAVARLEEEAQTAQHAVRRRHAATEVQLAESALTQFVEADMPNRLANERLELRSAQDRAQEAAEELAQIEIMYQDQDLDDVTAEFVVSRGRRSAERARARIEVMEKELRALEERELPRERQRLQLDVDKAVSNLAEVERDGEIAARNKGIAVQEATNAVERLERELAAALEEASS